MPLIQSYIMVNRFLSGIINHIWTIFWVSVMNILLQSPMSATSLMVMCDKSITWLSIWCVAFSTCVMPWLKIFVTYFFYLDWDIYFYDDKFTSNDHLVYHPPDEVWLDVHENGACCHELKECCCHAEGEQVTCFDRTSDKPSDPLPNFFVPEGGNGAADLNKDDESILPINAPEGALPTYLLLIWMTLNLPLIMIHVTMQ